MYVIWFFFNNAPPSLTFENLHVGRVWLNPWIKSIERSVADSYVNGLVFKQLEWTTPLWLKYTSGYSFESVWASRKWVLRCNCVLCRTRTNFAFFTFSISSPAIRFDRLPTKSFLFRCDRLLKTVLTRVPSQTRLTQKIDPNNNFTCIRLIAIRNMSNFTSKIVCRWA